MQPQAGELPARNRARVWATLLAYAVVIGIGATGIYEPLAQGSDDLWIVWVGLGGAHVGLGAGIDRWWALAVPVLGVAALALAGGPSADDVYVLYVVMFIVPFAVLLTFAGLIVGRGARHRLAIVSAAFLTAVPGIAWGGIETIDRSDAPRVPPSLERRLPTQLHLANLCPGSGGLPDRTRSRLEAQAETLIREVERHPDWILPYTFHSSDHPDERREITIEELGEYQLELYEVVGPKCEGGYQDRLRAVLE